MLELNEAMAWAVALKEAKKEGCGVDGVTIGEGEEQTIDDIYDEINFYLISRLLDEPIWVIDFRLYTMDALLVGNEKSELPSEDLANLVEEYGIPYTATFFEGVLEDYPIGAAEDFEQTEDSK